MSQYLTVSELKYFISENVLIGLSNDYNAREINETLVNYLLQSASKRVDDYLRQAYDVPFSNPDETIQSIVADITIFYLYSRRTEVPASIKAKYENAMELLRIMGRERYVEEESEMVGQDPITGASFNLDNGDDPWMSKTQVFTP